MDKKLAVSFLLKSYGQQLMVQEESSDEWHCSDAGIGTTSF